MVVVSVALVDVPVDEVSVVVVNVVVEVTVAVVVLVVVRHVSLNT